MACKLYSISDVVNGKPKDGSVGIPIDDVSALQRLLLENIDKLEPSDFVREKGEIKSEDIGEDTPVQKVRELYSRFAKDPSKPKELRDAIEQASRYYLESSNKFTSRMADGMIEVAKETGDIDALWEEASSVDLASLDDNAVPIKAMMMSKIANYYEATGQMEKAAAAYGKMFKTATNAGKFIQVFSAQSHPEAIIAKAKAQIELTKDIALKRENKATGKTNKETIEDIHETFTQGVNEATSNIDKSKKVEQAAKEVAKKKQVRESNSVYRERVKKDLKQAIDYLNEKLGINLTPNNDMNANGLTVGNLINLIAEAAVAAKQATETIEEAIDRVIALLKDKNLIGKNINVDNLKQSVSDRVAREQNKKAKQFIKENLADDFGLTLRQIAKDYYEDSNAFKGSLTDKLMADGGLSQSEAKEFAKVVESEYDKLLSKAKEQIEKQIDKVIPKDANTLATAAHKKLMQKINKAMLLGKVNMMDFSNLFDDAMGFVVLTPEMNQQLSDLKDGIKLFPEGSTAYYKRLQKFNTFLDKVDLMQKSSWSRGWILTFRVAKELFYNNLLSGTSTIYTNVRGILHTGVTLTGITAMVHGGAKGNGTKLYIESTKNLIKGFQQGVPIFKQILADGFNSQYGSEEAKQPIGPLKALMAKSMKEMDWYELPIKTFLYVPIKMVRAFIATDALAKQGFREYFATVKAYDTLLSAGYDSKAKNFWVKVHEVAHNTKADYARFKEQASIEAAQYKAAGIPIDKNFVGIRASELAQEERQANVADFAEIMAQRATLNNKPEGTLGQLYDVMNLAQKIPGAFTVIPFVKIGINMVDTWLDYSPWGLKRAIFGRGFMVGNPERAWNKYRIGKQGGAEWIDDRKMHLIRGSLGTLALTYIALALKDLLDDDPEQGAWNIIQNVTGNISDDPAKVAEARNNGFTPYTITFKGGFEFSYKESVLAPMFAWMGYSLDAKNFDKNEKEATTLMADNMVNAALFIKEQSFLQGISDMLSIGGRFENATSSKAGDKVGKFTVQTVKNILYPKFYESLFKGYKTVNNLPEYRPQNFSDDISSAIVEQFSKGIPYFEDVIENKVVDRMGYEVTANNYNVFPVPFAQQDAVKEMQALLGTKRDLGEGWRIVLDLGISTNYQISNEDLNGNKLNTNDRTKLSVAVSKFVQQRVIEEKDVLAELTPEDRQKLFNNFVSAGFKVYKTKFFGDKEIEAPVPANYDVKAVKKRTERAAKKIAKD